MPSNSGKMRRKPQAVRRTHILGGCSTCRRRHVKCDQIQPYCRTCQAARVRCEGFASGIQWASASPKRLEQQAGDVAETARRHLDTESSRQKMTSNLAVGLASGSVDASLTEVDSRIKDSHRLRNGSVNVGPFSVFSLIDLPASDQSEHPVHGERLEIDQPIDYTASSISDLDSLLDVGNVLGWNDLFDTGFDFTSPSHDEQIYEDPLSLLARVANQPSDVQHGDSAGGFTGLGALEPVDPQVGDIAPSLFVPRDMIDTEILSHGQALLKYFKDVVLPTYSPLPMNTKSPWEIMNFYAAVQTLADLTFLQLPNVKHANKANLFGTLACSAFMIAETQTGLPDLPTTKCQQILEHGSIRAKKHLQESLKTETCGTHKARYKDQLMAINTLIALATLRESQRDARCYLIDAERLLRLRGLAKTVLSRRARLLHHVYTWLRIVGESTFTIHDYANSALLSRVENSLGRSRNAFDKRSEELDAPAIIHGQLDDFLGIDTHETDSEPDVEEYKEQEVGIRDIHLQDVRHWPETLYLQIYSIPETWLSFVSQTTRLANVIDVVNASKGEVPHSFNASLRNKSARLETMICSLASKTASLHLSDSHNNTTGDSEIQRVESASEAMLRALNSALVIFFYRRIRDVHPWILQVHVNEVIEALKAFDRGIAQNSTYRCGTVGTPWPAFMAGCEAMTSANRSWIISWLEKSSRKSPTAAFRSCVEIMREVWHRRDTAMAAHNAQNANYDSRNRSQKKADTHCTWISVLRDKKLWPMLY